MRLLLSLLIIIYLVGVGVVLSPIVRDNWNSETASAFADSVGEALPNAFAWPVRLAHTTMGS
jgi:hypothetical protein